MKVWGELMEFQTEGGVGIHRAPGQLTWEYPVPLGYTGESRYSGQTATVIRGAGWHEANVVVGSIWGSLGDSRRSH